MATTKNQHDCYQVLQKTILFSFSLNTDMRKTSYRGKWRDSLRILFSPVLLFLINLHKHTRTNEARIIKTIGQIMMSAFVVESKELGGGVCVVEVVLDVEGCCVDCVVCLDSAEQFIGTSQRN